MDNINVSQSDLRGLVRGENSLKSILNAAKNGAVNNGRQSITIKTVYSALI
jgi:hypothetical protein